MPRIIHFKYIYHLHNLYVQTHKVNNSLLGGPTYNSQVNSSLIALISRGLLIAYTN